MTAARNSSNVYSMQGKTPSLREAKPENLSEGYDQFTAITNKEDVATIDMTREEMTARLELVEARSDARLSRFEERIDQAIGEVRRDRAELKEDFRSLASEFKSSKVQFTLAMVGTGIAIVLGIAAFNATVLSNMVASFESGKSTATAITQATEQIKQTQQQLQVVQEALTQKIEKK
jgi:hypothetical protein